MPIAAFQEVGVATTRPKVVTTQTMVPSTRTTTPTKVFSSATPLVVPGEDDDSLPQDRLPVTRDDEPYLYNLPADLYPVYRPLPLFANIIVAVLGLVASAIHTWKKIYFIQPLLTLTVGVQKGDIKKLLNFFSKALVAAVLSHVFLQEIFLAPSRVSIQTLQQNYFLPSSLSRYEHIITPLPEPDQQQQKKVDEENNDSSLTSQKIGVTFLRYENPNFRNNMASASNKKKRFSAMYVNHGFGASSLSWLPALPSLVNRVGAKVGLGHDAAGFGFTDRPKDVSLYTSQASASMGLSLLKNEIEPGSNKNGNEMPSTETNVSDTSPPSVLLLGHSMGSITTLHMALQLPKEIKKDIILVAPALGIAPSVIGMRKTNGILSKVLRPFKQVFQKVFISIPLSYVLRRTVGTKDFWKKGLLAVWGDPTLLSDSDVLRFQWPSIGRGWEKGLIDFSRAQLLPKQYKDTDLLEKVLALPNTKVSVVQGTSDLVVKQNVVQKFFEPYKSQVRIWELQNRGHDPFEEKPEEFVSTVMEILGESSS